MREHNVCFVWVVAAYTVVKAIGTGGLPGLLRKPQPPRQMGLFLGLIMSIFNFCHAPSKA